MTYDLALRAPACDKSLKTRLKTDFTVKYARKQLKLALVNKHRYTTSGCETTAIEVNHTPTKCDLFYEANHEIMIASFGFSARCT